MNELKVIENKEKKSNIFKNLIFFLVLIAITLYVILKDQSITQIIDAVQNVKIEYVLMGAFCMIIYIILEAVNIGRTLKILNEKSSFLKNIKYALIGFFFSSITPAASGGQPMQIYYMHKENISVANSTLALLINLTCMQIVTIGLALFSLIFNYSYMNATLIIFFLVGVSLNLTALILLVIGVFSKKLSTALVEFAVKICQFFKIKNIEEKQAKLENELNKYQESSKYLKENKIVFFKTLLTTLVQFIAYYSISYWTYRSFGLKEHNLFKVVTMQSILYATVSGIPSPGAVGVSEGAFIEIFKKIYPETLIKSATLLNRGINFYFMVLISVVVVIVNNIKINRGKE